MLHLQINHPMLSMSFCSVFEIFFSNQRSGVLILVDGKMRSILKWFTCVEILFLLNGNPYGQELWVFLCENWQTWHFGTIGPFWANMFQNGPERSNVQNDPDRSNVPVWPRKVQNCPNAVLPQRSSIEDLLKWSSFYTKVLISSFFPYMIYLRISKCLILL